MIVLLTHPAGGNISIDAGLVGDGHFTSLIEWAAISGKDALIVECAANAHRSKRASEKHKCGHLLAPANYGAVLGEGKEVPVERLSLDDDEFALSKDLAQEIKILTSCSLFQYADYHKIEVRDEDHEMVQNSTVVTVECDRDADKASTSMDDGDVVMDINGTRKRRKVSEEKVTPLDSLTTAMKDHMLLIHRAADNITKRYDPRYLTEEISEALKEGKEAKIDGYKVDTISMPIDMMAYLLSMAALPSINVSLFSPTQQECLLYAYKKMMRLEVTSVQLVDRIRSLPETAKLCNAAPLIVQYVYFFELKHYHERGMLKIATHPDAWKKIMD